MAIINSHIRATMRARLDPSIPILLADAGAFDRRPSCGLRILDAADPG